MNKLLLFFASLFFFTEIQAQNGLNFVGSSSTGCLVNTNQPSITGNAARTVEAWVNIPNPTATTQQVIVEMGSGSPNGSRFTLNVISGQYLRIEIAGNGFTGTTDITDGTWHHVAVTYNPLNATGQKAKLYVDGVLEAQNDFTVTMNTTSTNNIRIGGRTDNVNYLSGSVDEVRVWDIELSATQILADMNHEFCSLPITNLVAYYKFNEGVASGTNTSITTVANSANSSYYGTLSGFTKTGSTSNFVTGAPVSGNTFNTISESVCSSYTVPSNTRTYTASGVYKDTLPNAMGCDSIITINLTVVSLSQVSNLAVSNITSLSALLTWDSAINATGYEYALTTSATPPMSGTVISDTFYNASGLTQGTTYYFHLRAICASSNLGPWTTISFTTLQACYAVTGLSISNITQTGAKFNWDADTATMWYEYLVTSGSEDPSPAGSGTTKNYYTTAILSPGQTYYFHVRKKCNNFLLSPWINQEFTTLEVVNSLTELSNQLFSVTPNPTSGRITIKMNNYVANEQTNFMVTDVFGKVLRSYATSQDHLDMDLSDLPSGVYFVRVNAKSGNYIKQIAIYH